MKVCLLKWRIQPVFATSRSFFHLVGIKFSLPKQFLEVPLSTLEHFSTQINSSIESLFSSLDQNISGYTSDLIDFTHSGYEKLSSFFSEVTEGAQTEAQNLSSAIQNRLDDISTQLSLRAELFSGEYCGDINAILALNVFGIYLKSAFFDV